MEIPMTSPVTTEIVPLGDGTVDRTMCFFLGTAFDDEEPPAPNSDVVQITTAEPITIYTRLKKHSKSTMAWPVLRALDRIQ